MQGLAELGLVINNRDGVYHPTGRGLYLQRSHPRTLADAALMWAGKTCEAWSGITQALRIGRSSFTAAHGQGFFEHLHERPAELHEYHRSLASYARHDYQALADAVNFGVHHRILDAGGGTGELVFALLRAFPGLSGIVMDRPRRWSRRRKFPGTFTPDAASSAGTSSPSGRRRPTPWSWLAGSTTGRTPRR